MSSAQWEQDKGSQTDDCGSDDDMESPKGILANATRPAVPEVSSYRKLYITARMPSITDCEGLSVADSDSEDVPSSKNGKSVRFTLPTELPPAPRPAAPSASKPTLEPLPRQKSDASLPLIIRKRQKRMLGARHSAEARSQTANLEDTLDKVIEANRPSTVHGGRPTVPSYDSFQRERVKSGKVLNRRYTYLRPPHPSPQQRLRLLASTYSANTSRSLLEPNSPDRKELLKTKSFQIHSPGKPFPKASAEVKKLSSASLAGIKDKTMAHDYRQNFDFMDVYQKTVHDLYTIRFRSSDVPEVDPDSAMRSDYYSVAIDKRECGDIARPPQSTIPHVKEIKGMLHGVPKRLHCRDATEYNSRT